MANNCFVTICNISASKTPNVLRAAQQFWNDSVGMDHMCPNAYRNASTRKQNIIVLNDTFVAPLVDIEKSYM